MSLAPNKFKTTIVSHWGANKSIKKISFIKISWLLSLILLGWLFIFLYINFYEPLTNIQILMVLKKQVSPEKLNMQGWEKINQNLNEKKQLIDFSKIKRDPFN